MAEPIAQRVVRRAVTDMAHKTMWSMNLLCCRTPVAAATRRHPERPEDWDDKAEGADYETGQSPKKPEVDRNSELSHFHPVTAGTGAAWAARESGAYMQHRMERRPPCRIPRLG